MKKINFILLIVFCLCLGACASGNSLRLLYSPTAPTLIPEATAPTIVVVLFEDKRNSSGLGVKRDGTAFVSGTMVNDWVTRALADELGRQGLQVSFSPTVAAAKSANPDYILTGAVTELWVKDVSPAGYSATITLSYSLSNKKGVVYGENISSSQERSGISGNKLAEDVLSESLRNVLAKATQTITQLCLARK